ncbi:hypothetical protein SPI_01590 [Niveomyces insectorum RCEF 264]|uniref:Uncharacterized protein n=1 Tax=Niveomyces insectorum RCEF 264 TaxID=1081102 RepID=A0A167Z2W4_9HYPO|nr:hypothetical protein SPI_01590 [Niveomyces insectorum RCEF 264]
MRRHHQAVEKVTAAVFAMALDGLDLRDPATVEPLCNGSAPLPELPVEHSRTGSFQRFRYLGRPWTIKTSDKDPGLFKQATPAGEAQAAQVAQVPGADTPARTTGIVTTVRRLRTGRLNHDDIERFLQHLAMGHRATLCQAVIPLAELSNAARWKQTPHAQSSGIVFNVVPVDDGDGNWFVTIVYHGGDANYAITFDVLDRIHDDSFSRICSQYLSRGIGMTHFHVLNLPRPRDVDADDSTVYPLGYVKQFLRDSDCALNAVLCGRTDYVWTVNPAQLRGEALCLLAPAVYQAQKAAAHYTTTLPITSDDSRHPPRLDNLFSAMSDVKSRLAVLQFRLDVLHDMYPGDYDALVQQLPLAITEPFNDLGRIARQAILWPAGQPSSVSREATISSTDPPELLEFSESRKRPATKSSSGYETLGAQDMDAMRRLHSTSSTQLSSAGRAKKQCLEDTAGLPRPGASPQHGHAEPSHGAQALHSRPSSPSTAQPQPSTYASVQVTNPPPRPQPSWTIDISATDFAADPAKEHRYLSYKSPYCRGSLVVYEDAIPLLRRRETGWLHDVLAHGSATSSAVTYPAELCALSKCIDVGQKQVAAGEEFLPESGCIGKTYSCGRRMSGGAPCLATTHAGGSSA